MKSKSSFLYSYISGLFLLGIFSLTSCLEGDDDLFRGTSSVLFVNVYNDGLDGVNVSVDDQDWIYGLKSYNSVTTYNSFYSGVHSFSATPKGSTSAEALTSVSQDLKADTVYTSFLTGKLGEGKIVFFADTMASPGSRRAKIRFINLSPDMSTIDFGITDSARITRNLNYLNAAYFSVDTSIHTYNVYRAGLTVPLVSLRFKPVAGRIYTMYTKGLIAREGIDSAGVSYFVQPDR